MSCRLPSQLGDLHGEKLANEAGLPLGNEYAEYSDYELVNTPVVPVTSVCRLQRWARLASSSCCP